MKSILPLILVVIVLMGAITYSLAKRSLPSKPVESIGISANKLENNLNITPTPTSTKTVTFENLVVTPTASIPVITEETTSKGGLTNKVATTTVTKTTICTPVYGSADTCTEHIVVDTGAENALFMNFAGLAYLGGLASFVKAKSLKR